MENVAIMAGPCFIVGNSRSGTTMTGRILNNHTAIFTFKEIHFFESLWMPDDAGNYIDYEQAIKLAARLLTIQRDGYLMQGKPERFIKEAKRIIGNNNKYTSENIFSRFLEYETKLNGKLISCDQTPRNVLYIKEILELFPDARIINMVRDPRDVLLSQKAKWKRRYLGASQIPLREAFRSWVNYHPIVIAMLWKASINSANKFNGDPRVLFLMFEELLNCPEEKVKEICGFIGVDFQDRMLQIPQVGSSTGKDDKSKIGFNENKVGSWQKRGLNDTEIYFCEKIVGKEMELLGYSLSDSKRNSFLYLWYIFIFPMQLSLALLLNIKRMRNVTQSIIRRLKL